MKILVRNADFTSRQMPPYPITSWIDYWEARSGQRLMADRPYLCPACGRAVMRRQLDGCHLQLAQSSPVQGRHYIAPLCDGCNHRKDSFYIDKELLVAAR